MKKQRDVIRFEVSFERPERGPPMGDFSKPTIAELAAIIKDSLEHQAYWVDDEAYRYLLGTVHVRHLAARG
jgi:hypothetical protein